MILAITIILEHHIHAVRVRIIPAVHITDNIDKLQRVSIFKRSNGKLHRIARNDFPYHILSVTGQNP